MAGQGTYRASNTSVLAVCAIEAPRVVPSVEFDERLRDTYKRVGLRPGLLNRLVGIRERRWWADGFSYLDGAAVAGAKALAESGVDAEQIGLLINTSVSRAHLEPSSAVWLHDALGLAPHCLNFDIANACLGFLNGIQVASSLIGSGQIDYALLVNGEDARAVQESTIGRLSVDGVTSAQVVNEFATLTLGSGAAAMVLGRSDRHAEGHAVIGGITRASSEHKELCVGDVDMMRTDAKGLLDAGLDLSARLWADCAEEFDWPSGMDRYIIHQVSQVHTDALCDRLDIDPELVPRTFPTYGNIGPASVPFTLAQHSQDLETGDRVLLMGIGSGLNASCAEISW